MKAAPQLPYTNKMYDIDNSYSFTRRTKTTATHKLTQAHPEQLYMGTTLPVLLMRFVPVYNTYTFVPSHPLGQLLRANGTENPCICSLMRIYCEGGCGL